MVQVTNKVVAWHLNPSLFVFLLLCMPFSRILKQPKWVNWSNKTLKRQWILYKCRPWSKVLQSQWSCIHWLQWNLEQVHTILSIKGPYTGKCLSMYSSMSNPNKLSRAMQLFKVKLVYKSSPLSWLYRIFPFSPHTFKPIFSLWLLYIGKCNLY